MSADPEKYPHLANAPIVEAVIDWRVKLAAQFDIARLKGPKELLSRGYSAVDEQRQFEHIFSRRPVASHSKAFDSSASRPIAFAVLTARESQT